MTSRRVLAGMVATMTVVAFVGLAVLSDGSTEPDSAQSSSTTTTTHRRRPAAPGTAETTTTAVEQSTVPTAAPGADFVSEPIDGRRLVVLSEGSITSIDLDGNTITRIDHDAPVDPIMGPPLTSTLLAAGTRLFFVGGGKAYVVPQALDAPVRELGEAQLALPSNIARRIWVARERGGGFVFDEITDEGNTTRTSRPLPVDSTPIAIVGDAIVLHAPERLEVWEPMTGRTRWASPDGAEFIAVAGSRLIWRRNCISRLCVFHIVDPSTGSERTIAHGGISVDSWQGGFAASPDGRYLAASTAFYSATAQSFRITVFDMETGVIVEADASDAGRPVWSPDSKWIFVVLGDPNQPPRDAFRFDRMALRPVQLRMPLEAGGLTAVVL